MKEQKQGTINKLILMLKKIRKSIIEYITTNRLFIAYVILSLIGVVLVRAFTVGTKYLFRYETFFVDFSLIMIIGSFSYLIKPKNRFKYLFIVLIIFTIMEVVNSIYYTFFTSFASFGELATAGQTETVVGSIFDRLKITHTIYILFPVLFFIIHKGLNKTAYYKYISVVEKGKKMFGTTFVIGLVVLGTTFINATDSDFSKLAKRWNRAGVVDRFGIIMYQANDLIQTLTPKFNSLFGYDKAVQKFREYFTNKDNDKYKKKNQYTNILEGYNIIFVHMEGMETYLMDVKFNGVEAVPNVKKLANEGMFFSKFYPQISSGTSSDTEFTLLTSLMPAQSGTIFTSYYDREYVTIPKLLKEKGYYTFSMHGNHKSMWNRSNVHPKLGYDEGYFKEAFEFNDDLQSEDCINLGISDKLFFKQAIPILENIEEQNKNYMGTIITLSNHSPFKFLDKYGEYDMTSKFRDCDEFGNCENKTTDYLHGTAVGNYIMSAHYADAALGEFIEYINNSEYFNNTVFVFYGDHDAKLSLAEKNYLYNYDYKTGELKDESDPTYKEYDYYDHELNKNTPLIFWTKNKELRSKLNGSYDYVMGMYDVMPTLGNMLGIKNDFALGNDIFNIKNNNVVVYPNGNFTTNLVYYNSSKGDTKIIKDGAEIKSDYISSLIEKTESILEVSNAIVVHDLIKLEGDNIKNIKENGAKEK